MSIDPDKLNQIVAHTIEALDRGAKLLTDTAHLHRRDRAVEHPLTTLGIGRTDAAQSSGK